MKKLYLVLLILVVLLATMPVYGASVGNLPTEDGFELGFACDSSEKDIELKSPFIMYQDSGSKSEEDCVWSWNDEIRINGFNAAEKTQASYFKPCFTFLDRAVQIFGKIGSVSGGQDWSNIEIHESGNNTDNYSTGYYKHHSDGIYSYKNMPEVMVNPRWNADFGSYYGLGIKYAHKMDDGLKIGISAQYSVSRFKKDITISKNEEFGEYNDEYNDGFNDYYAYSFYTSSSTTTITDYEITEPQISIIASKEFDKFGIYGGATYSMYQGKAKGNNKTFYYEFYKGSYSEGMDEESGETSTDFTFKTKSVRNLNLFMGGDYSLSKKFALNAEVAVGNEQRITVGGIWKF